MFVLSAEHWALGFVWSAPLGKIFQIPNDGDSKKSTQYEGIKKMFVAQTADKRHTENYETTIVNGGDATQVVQCDRGV